MPPKGRIYVAVIGRIGDSMSIRSYFYNITRQRASVVDNGYGASVETWTASQTTIQGLIDGDRDSAINAAGQFQTILNPTLYTEPDTDITQNDRVVDGGKAYRVVNVPDNVTKRNHHLEIALERLEVEP